MSTQPSLSGLAHEILTRVRPLFTEAVPALQGLTDTERHQYAQASVRLGALHIERLSFAHDAVEPASDDLHGLSPAIVTSLRQTLCRVRAISLQPPPTIPKGVEEGYTAADSYGGVRVIRYYDLSHDSHSTRIDMDVLCLGASDQIGVVA